MGNIKLLDIEPGHDVRYCTKLSLRFRVHDGMSMGKLLVIATYQSSIVALDEDFVDRVFINFKIPPPPPESPPAIVDLVGPPLPQPRRPPPDERVHRVAERKAMAEISRSKKPKVDDGTDLLGKHWYDSELGLCKVIAAGEYEGKRTLTYSHTKPDNEGDLQNCSSVMEVRQWCQS